MNSSLKNKTMKYLKITFLTLTITLFLSACSSKQNVDKVKEQRVALSGAFALNLDIQMSFLVIPKQIF